MPRPPEVFVRPLLDEERAELSRIGSRTQNGTRLRRTMIVQMSSQDPSVPDIVALTGFSEDYVREVIHDFNDHGLDALDPKWSGGRPPTFTEEIRRKIRNLALTRPNDLGLAFTCWSLSKLAEQLIERGIVESISLEWLRQILRAYGITFQRTKTFKASPDP